MMGHDWSMAKSTTLITRDRDDIVRTFRVNDTVGIKLDVEEYGLIVGVGRPNYLTIALDGNRRVTVQASVTFDHQPQPERR